MAYFELNARRWQARVGRGVPPPMFVTLYVNIVCAYLEKRWASALGATWLLDAS